MGFRKGAVEVMDLKEFYSGRRVLVTGHTGFKGAWLTLWLRELGADILGIGLESELRPGLLYQFGLETEIQHVVQDIRDAEALSSVVEEFNPECVFHLAAQALVRRSYREPVNTWATNVIGSINLMESMQRLEQSVVSVMVTTDKVYENQEWVAAYRESDPLGGHDPYSSSKAAMEIAVASWRKSFFGAHDRVAIATARAGNVIGGGDYSEDRIIPDIVRSLNARKPLKIRNPQATRPWQHVLEPLSGYLRLAQALGEAQARNDIFSLESLCSAWNFGPLPEANRTVAAVAEEAFRSWPGEWQKAEQKEAPHEATFLGLAIDKATRLLGWYPRRSFEDAIRDTMTWYRQHLESGECPRRLSVDQIREFECLLLT